MMKNKFHGWHIIMFILMGFLMACSDKNDITISCNEDNDLYLTLLDNNIDCIRHGTPYEAVRNAPEGSAVLILADGYPRKTTVIDSLFFKKASDKRLRLFIEYPSYLPGVQTGNPRGTRWERAVVASDEFAPEVRKLRILAVHDCRFIPLKALNPDIVIARIAGFDSAVYGLPDEALPLLFEMTQSGDQGGIMIATTKLSQFLTARYAPADCWQAIWDHILAWLLQGRKLPELKWTAPVRPCYNRNEALPYDFEQQALKSGVDWFFNSGLIVHPTMLDQYNKPANPPDPTVADPDLSLDWPYGHRINKLPENMPTGNGTLGIMEGYDSKIFYDGSQAVRWWNRGDCNAETAGAMGLAGLVFNDQKYLLTSSNIGDWLFSKSMISLGDRSDPGHPAYGLSGWNDSPEYCGSGTMDGFAVYYGDDNARVILGMMMTAAAQKTAQYDKRILNIILGNLHVSGIYGFQPNRINQDRLEERGWESYFTDKNGSFSPHYQANIWACYLWAYEQTGFELFLDRAKRAIKMTMEAYPDKWEWTNGIQQERAKMLLPLSWLVRIEDKPLHREWLHLMAGDLLARQDESGAIPEEIGEAGKGGFPPPSSNEAYGTSETPLIQSNSDKASDLLYTLDFAFIGLHEAAAATGEKFFSDAEDKLAEFLCRIQIRSEKYPELNGGWFRAFDFNRWEYWASNGDAGWGAWSIETGWSQSWITAVLALRKMGTSLWEITHDSNIEVHFNNLRKEMLPDKILNKLN